MIEIWFEAGKIGTVHFCGVMPPLAARRAVALDCEVSLDGMFWQIVSHSI